MKFEESTLQKNCIAWFRMQYSYLSKMIFAVPNGGRRNAREAAIMKAEGVTAGVADVLLLVSRNGHNCLCIEFKTAKGRQTELQREWQKHAEFHGNKYIVVRSFEQFRSEVKDYLTVK